MKNKFVPQGEYCEEYMRYLGIAKTARRSYAESVRLLKARGFKDLSSFKTLKAGDKVYRGYEDRTVMAAVIGKKKISEAGIKVVGGHTDARGSTSSRNLSTRRAGAFTSTAISTAASRNTSGSRCRSPRGFCCWSGE